VLVTILVATLPFTFALAFVDVLGARGAAENPAYAVHLDRAILWNLLTYLGWTANFIAPTVRGFADAVDSKVWGWGIVAGLLWNAGLLAPGLRSRGWLAAGALYLTLLLPVLPLGNHTYHYYLYAPLAGAAWCVAALLDWAMASLASRAGPGRARSGRTPARRASGERSRDRAPEAAAPAHSPAAIGALGAVAVLLTWNGAVLVSKIERHPFVHPVLRSDPTVDRAIIARNAVSDLSRYSFAPGTRLHFWFPRALAPDRRDSADSTRETYWERNVKSALYDGLAVRVANPRVAEVRFERDFLPESSSDLYAVYGLDGHLNVVTAAELDSLIRTLPGGE
jgi:hypothetical protein